jgi:predicted enzyme related to lactoylglutathione lyase
MGTRTQHAPGTFSWVDLTTRDGAAAKDFYGGLFGWEFEDNEIPGDGGVYTMCSVDGENVAAISPTTEDFPPHWNNYVTVASTDDAAAKAKELGGSTIQDPFDVMEAGRMAVLQDPTGAMLCVWEPRDAIGAGRVNEPGCLTWNELHTPAPDKALEFYTGLFGWSKEEMETGEGNPRYIVIRNGERSNGGVMDAHRGEPPHWLPYFVVESRDGAIARTKELGGRDWIQMDMPQGGKIAVLSDPQGAPFAVLEWPVDD